MIRHWILALPLFFTIITTLSACGQCNVTEGNYVNSGGSEQSTHLKLSSDKTFSLNHDEWQAGQYDKRDTTKLAGIWSCKKQFITLQVQGKTHNAELITIGENPLGLDANTRALFFSASPDNKDSYLYNTILYPEK